MVRENGLSVREGISDFYDVELSKNNDDEPMILSNYLRDLNEAKNDSMLRS